MTPSTVYKVKVVADTIARINRGGCFGDARTWVFRSAAIDQDPPAVKMRIVGFRTFRRVCEVKL